MTFHDPHPEERRSRISKGEIDGLGAWFETAFGLLTMRGLGGPLSTSASSKRMTFHDLHPEERQSRVLKGERDGPGAWFETAFGLLTMRGLGGPSSTGASSKPMISLTLHPEERRSRVSKGEIDGLGAWVEMPLVTTRGFGSLPLVSWL